MAICPFAVWKELPENRTQQTITPRAVGLHTAVSNQESLWPYFNSGSEDDVEVESHFYLPREDIIEQYIDTEIMAHCQVDGNPFTISVEAWDGAGVLWTPKPDGSTDSQIPGYTASQFKRLVRLLRWIKTAHPQVPMRPMQTWDDSGIGYHRQFIGRPGWARSYRACPGNKKISQIPTLITAVKEIEIMTPEQEAKIDRIITMVGQVGQGVINNRSVIPSRTWAYPIPLSGMSASELGQEEGYEVSAKGLTMYGAAAYYRSRRLDLELDELRTQLKANQAQLTAIIEAIKAVPQVDQAALLAAINAIPQVDEQSLAAAIERLDAEMVADRLTISVKEENQQDE